jgi:hypothetical protein
LSASDLNRIVDALNMLINLRIVESDTAPRIVWDAVGPMIEIPRRVTKVVQAAAPGTEGRVRVRICNAETGAIEEWEIVGRKIS